MRLQNHPEYTKYLQDLETVRRCQQVVVTWRAEGGVVSATKVEICWTYERVLGFVRSLVRMFQAYNRVLWEGFPYCRACGGGCCVLDASHVGLFDGIALALLELSLPPLSDESSAGERDCIYLNGQQCALPAEWRTIKCWSFYCLGGRWDPRVSLGEHHGALARALKDVVLERLPEDLRRYERLCGDPLISHLDDPTAFAQALDDALYEIMVSPLRARYVLLGERPARGLGERAEALSLEERVLCFVSQAMDALLVSGTLDQDDWPLPPDQLLADLELLEWIVMGRPSSQVQLLREMQARYAHLAALPGGGQPAVWQYLSECVDEVLETCD